MLKNLVVVAVASLAAIPAMAETFRFTPVDGATAYHLIVQKTPRNDVLPPYSHWYLAGDPDLVCSKRVCEISFDIQSVFGDKPENYTYWVRGGAGPGNVSQYSNPRTLEYVPLLKQRPHLLPEVDLCVGFNDICE